MWFMFATMLSYLRSSRRYERFVMWGGFEWPRWSVQRDILGLGLPIAASVEAEAGLFAGVALIMGTLGATQVAGHQIAINYAATMFMVPLAFHSATTIRVGQALGRNEPALCFPRWCCCCFVATSRAFTPATPSCCRWRRRC
jgi:MATE family multidrug resistance protein